MRTTNDNKRQQRISKLREMFPMDQADLDFGICRNMNAKRDEVERFLDKDLTAMGLSMSDAVRLFLRRVVVDPVFPVEFKVPDAETQTTWQ